MKRLSERIRETQIPKGLIALWWLGQAGFAFKTETGALIYVDPYLSDAVFKLDGFKRLSVSPIDADEVEADLVVLTHEHADHLDPEAIPIIAARNTGCLFAAPSGCLQALDRAGVNKSRIIVLEPDVLPEVGGILVHPSKADHGSFSPTAISVVLDFGGVKVMLSGDGSWRSDYLSPLYDLGLDLAIACINGSYGNMNHLDAARMLAESGAAAAMPCHFWTLGEQGAGDPFGFIAACKLLAPAVDAFLASPGELVLVGQGGRSR
jgi:L-ascorbate 6-phosphate lactonase